MSQQQINLFDPALLRKRELMTLANIVAMTVGLFVVVGAWGAMARAQLDTVSTEHDRIMAQIKLRQTEMAEAGQLLAAQKPNPQLAAELASARDLLAARKDIAEALGRQLGPQSASFAEYLRGFARQTPTGLWLTGFVISDGGHMEIRGRMTDAAMLPEYIRRLNGESAFQGRAFASLNVAAGKPTGTAPAAANQRAPYLEFVLAPVVEKLGAAPPGSAPRAMGDADVKPAEQKP